MNNFFVTNRQVIRNLALNTGTTEAPVFTTFCTMSEMTISTDFETKDFFVFCDAIRRSVITGSSITIEASVKIDMNNQAIISMLGDFHNLIALGEVAQFNNIEIQFELLENITANVLSYKKYKVPAVMKISDFGGAAEDEGQYKLELVLNGTGTVVQD